MGKPKTQRTDELRRADERLMWGDHVINAIEQYNLDRLIAQGILVEGPASAEHEDPQSPPVCYSH